MHTLETNKFSERQAKSWLVKAGINTTEAKETAKAIKLQEKISMVDLEGLLRNSGNNEEMTARVARAFFGAAGHPAFTEATRAISGGGMLASSARPTAQRGVVRRYKRPIIGAVAAVSLALLGFVGFMAISTHRAAKKTEAAAATPPAPAPAETPTVATPAPTAPATDLQAKSCSDSCISLPPDQVMDCLVNCIATVESDNSKLKKLIEKNDAKLAAAKAEYEQRLKVKDDEITAAKAEATAKVEAKAAEAKRELATKDAAAKKAMAEKEAEMKRQAAAAQAQATQAATEAARIKAEAEAKSRVPTCAVAIEVCKSSAISQAMKRQGRSDAWIAEQCERSAKFKQAAKQCQ